MEHTTPFGHSFDQLANFESRDGLRTPVLLLEAEYNRARACWAACDGVCVEWLEAQADPASEELFGKTAPLDKRLQAAMQDAEAAKAQRDELLEALTNLANTFHEGRATIAQPESAGYVGSVIDAAEALIAKHKGAEHG